MNELANSEPTVHREQPGSKDDGSRSGAALEGAQDPTRAGVIAGRVVPAWQGLEAELQELQDQHGHGHPEALEVEERLAGALAEAGRVDDARRAYEEVLTYRAVLDGEHAERTASVARDLFALVCGVGDGPAMAEVYYRFLSWIPMRDPLSLTPALREVLGDVETLLARET